MMRIFDLLLLLLLLLVLLLISSTSTTGFRLLSSSSSLFHRTTTTTAINNHHHQKRRRRKSLLLSSLSNMNEEEEDDDVAVVVEQEEATNKEPIYLDYAATTPIHPEVFNAMIPYFTTHFGNPSSSHSYGEEPRAAIKRARAQIASCLLLLSGGEEEDKAKDHHQQQQEQEELIDDISNGIIFTGCGTESDNMAIHIAVQSFVAAKNNNNNNNNSQQGAAAATTIIPHIVTSNVEHPAIDEYLKSLERNNRITCTRVPVQQDGTVSVSDVMDAAIQDENTCLVTIMMANNEIGAINPVFEIARECRSRRILFHTDAAQAVGKVPIVDTMRSIDMITIVGHKFGAPKGIGALYVRRRPECLTDEQNINNNNNNDDDAAFIIGDPLLIGGGQEMGRRAGTENVPYIVGMGKAAELFGSGENLETNAKHMEDMRSRLLSNLESKLGSNNLHVNGPKDIDKRLPNTLSVGIKGVQSGDLLKQINHKVAASAGSACHSSGGKVSSVLLAMKVPADYINGTLRLSVGVGTTAQEVDDAADIIAREVKKQWDSARG